MTSKLWTPQKSLSICLLVCLLPLENDPIYDSSFLLPILVLKSPGIKRSDAPVVLSLLCRSLHLQLQCRLSPSQLGHLQLVMCAVHRH